MAIGDMNGLIQNYILEDISYSLSIINSFQAHSDSIWRIKQCPFNTNSNYVATCSSDGTVKIWNVSVSSPFNWTLITTYSQHSSGVLAFEWLDSDTLASSGHYDDPIKIWSVISGQTKQEILTNSNVWSLKLLSYSSSFYLAAGFGSFRREINIYNIKDGTLFSTLIGHMSDVRDIVQLNPNTLASSSEDKTIRIWNLTTSKCIFILKEHAWVVYGLKQITSDILASGSSDETIRLWNITNGKLIRTLTGHTDWIWNSLDLINDNGQILISASEDRTIKIWNRTNGECLSTTKTTASKIYSLAVINLCIYLIFNFFFSKISTYQKLRPTFP
jgi:WD40 repeat protein